MHKLLTTAEAAPLIGVGRRRQPREKKCEYQGFRHHSLLK